MAIVSSISSRYFSAVGLHVGRDLDLVPLRAELLVAPDERLHLHQVDETGERLVALRATGADGQVQHARGGVEARLDHLHGAIEVRPDAVHLVDEAHARDVVLVGLTPHGLGLRLDAGDRVEHRHGAVEDAQRALDLDGEVHVTGRVDDVDPVVVPDAGRGRRRDRDAALLLLRHVVHGRRTVVDLTDLVALAGVVEDALRRRGLARVDVGHDADVAGALQGELTLGHLSLFLYVRCAVICSGVDPGWGLPGVRARQANPAAGTMFDATGGDARCEVGRPDHPTTQRGTATAMSGPEHAAREQQVARTGAGEPGRAAPLAVGAVDDPMEREADEIAERIVASLDAVRRSPTTGASRIRRAATGAAPLGAEGGSLDAGTESMLNSQLGRGGLDAGRGRRWRPTPRRRPGRACSPTS